MFHFNCILAFKNLLIIDYSNLFLCIYLSVGNIKIQKERKCVCLLQFVGLFSVFVVQTYVYSIFLTFYAN